MSRREAVIAAMAAITFVAPLRAQQPEGASCRAAFDQFAADLARNYAGFADKVPAPRRAAYDSLVAAQRARAGRVRTSRECLDSAFNDWVRFFRDGHLRVGLAGADQAAVANGADSAAVRMRFAGWPRREIGEDSARRVADALAGRDGVVGIWEAVGASYRLAIVPAEDTAGAYDAVVLRADGVYWLPGQLKATLRRGANGAYAMRFYLRDRSELRFPATVAHGVLRGPQGIVFVRHYPAERDTALVRRVLASQNVQFAARALSPATVLVQLPSFDASVTAQVDSVARIAGQLLRGRPNLIVDVRGNGGGTDRNYSWLLPLLYTKPSVEVTSALYATDDNIARYEALAVSPELSWRDRRNMLALVERMRPFRGRFMPRENFTYRQDSAYTFPQRVAVVIDEGCASSCEQLVLSARASDKVVLYGTRTAGILDYANLMTLASADGRYQLRYPTSRSQRLPQDPVDPDGIPAQIRIPADEAFAVEWVQRQLERAGGRAARAASLQPAPPGDSNDALLERLATTAARSGFVVGLSAIDVGSGRRVSLRGSERFPMASVYKIPIALRVLHLVDGGTLRLDSVVTIGPDAFAPHYSPLAERAGSRPVALTVDSLLSLMLGGSDNTASDALLRIAGGAPAVTRHLESLGITGVRVDRSERELGFAQRGVERLPQGRAWSRALFDSVAGAVSPAAQRAAWERYQLDPRDTSTPDAMADLLAAVARGAGLRPDSRRRLLDVMRRSPTGAARIRAGVPAGSLVAHKTGTAGPVVNDVALVTLPAGRGELALALFVRGGEAPDDAARERVIAELTRQIVEGFFPTVAAEQPH